MWCSLFLVKYSQMSNKLCLLNKNIDKIWTGVDRGHHVRSNSSRRRKNEGRLLLSSKGPWLASLIINAILFLRTWTSLICVTNTHFHEMMPWDQVATLFPSYNIHPFAFPSYSVTNLQGVYLSGPRGAAHYLRALALVCFVRYVLHGGCCQQT